MKKFTVLFSIVLLSIGANAQTVLAASIPSSPMNAGTTASVVSDDVLVLKETEYDFGKIPQGKPVTHIFEVANNGKDSLHIQNVQASCGCTTPEWDHDKVQAPGEKTVITVGYNAANEGAFNKQITITYNGVETKQITIKGEVWKTPATSVPENNELKALKD